MNELFRRTAIILASTATLLTLASCAWMSPQKPQQALRQVDIDLPPPPAASDIQPQKAAPSKEFIEVVWQIPDAKVDNYIIRYGTDPEHLTGEIEVRPDDVQKIQHERYGDAYRYLIANPPHEQTVYVTVAAVTDGNESAPTRAFEVGPVSPATVDSATPPNSGVTVPPLPEIISPTEPEANTDSSPLPGGGS